MRTEAQGMAFSSQEVIAHANGRRALVGRGHASGGRLGAARTFVRANRFIARLI
jgi:hypothetical protein